MHVPLFEFDPSPDAVINPSIHRPPLGFPRHAVMCWFGNVVRERTAGIEPVYQVPFEHGDHPVCIVEHCGDSGGTGEPWGRRAGGGHLARRW